MANIFISKVGSLWFGQQTTQGELLPPLPGPCRSPIYWQFSEIAACVQRKACPGPAVGKWSLEKASFEICSCPQTSQYKESSIYRTPRHSGTWIILLWKTFSLISLSLLFSPSSLYLCVCIVYAGENVIVYDDFFDKPLFHCLICRHHKMKAPLSWKDSVITWGKGLRIHYCTRLLPIKKDLYA